MFIKLIRKILKDQSGMALPMALILMVAATFIVVPGLWAAGNMIKVNQNFSNDTLAYYAAKSGIEDVYWALGNNDMAARPLTGSGYKMANQVNGMDVWVKEENIVGHTYYISSTAKLNGNSLRTVHVSMNVDLTGGYPFKYAIASRDGPIDIAANSQVKYLPNTQGLKADIWANGDINIGGQSNVTIDGQGYYTGDNLGSCSAFTVQPCIHSTEPYPFQPLDLTWYWSEATKGNAWGGSMPGTMPALYCGTSTYTLSADTVLGGAGNYSFINGNLDINAKKVTLKGVVWVNGYIISTKNSAIIKTDPAYPLSQYYFVAHGYNNTTDKMAITIKNATIDANGNLNLVADTGSIDVEAVFGPSSTAAKLGVMFAPNGKVFLKGNASGARPQVGAIYGKSVEVNSNVDVYYNTALQQNPVGGYKLNVTTINMNEFGG